VLAVAQLQQVPVTHVTQEKGNRQEHIDPKR